jgi:hypothetical protein
MKPQMIGSLFRSRIFLVRNLFVIVVIVIVVLSVVGIIVGRISG